MHKKANSYGDQTASNNELKLVFRFVMWMPALRGRRFCYGPPQSVRAALILKRKRFDFLCLVFSTCFLLKMLAHVPHWLRFSPLIDEKLLRLNSQTSHV
jgi:hypothetical protein